MKPINSYYFDYAAATPLDPKALKPMLPYLAENFYNPSALYVNSRQVKQQLEAARHQVADILGAKSSEIIFTAGATEANNLAIAGTCASHSKTRLIPSSIEHESVLEPMQQLTSKGYQIAIARVKPDGLVDISHLARQINDNTLLVSVMYANNEIGTIQPIKEIAKLLQAVRAKRRTKLPLYLHTDAAQAANYLDLHVSRLGVDLMTLNGSKIYGPKQSGCLYVRAGTQLSPLILGGGQERGLRSGTENVAGCIGFAKALEVTQSRRQAETHRLTKLRYYALNGLQVIDGLSVNGSLKQRLPNNINISIHGVSGERLVHQLDSFGIMVATGSACSANNDEPSHVLKALGMKPADINSSLRITLGRQTTKAAIDYLHKKLAEVVNNQRA